MGPKPIPKTVQSVSRNEGFGSNATSTKKRPFRGAIVAPGIKRPRNTGPFSDGSESEGAEKSDHTDTPKKPTPRHALITHQNNRLSLSSLRAKALNSSRLRSLLNKNQDSSTPHIHTQQRDVAKERKGIFAENRAQQTPAQTGPTQHILRKTPTTTENTQACSENAKPKSCFSNSLNAPTGSGHQMRDSTNTKQVRVHNYQLDPTIKSNSQQNSPFQDTAPSVRHVGNTDHRVLEASRGNPKTSKIELNNSSQTLTQAVTKVEKRTITPAVIHHSLGTVPDRPLQKSDREKPPTHLKTVKQLSTSKGSRSSVNNGGTLPRGLDVVQTCGSLNLKSSNRAPQPLTGIQVRTQSNAIKVEGAESERETTSSQDPTRSGIHTGVGTCQNKHKQDGIKERGSQKVIS